MRPDAIKMHGLREADVAAGATIARRAARSAAFHRRSAAGRLLPRLRRRDAQPARAALRSASNCPTRASRCRRSITSASTATRRPARQVDLSFASLLDDLKAAGARPARRLFRRADDAMVYLALRDLEERDVRIERQRFKGVQHFEAG